ncbi:arsenic resistance N-acetyltransferase ArsN2 [Acetobacteroides hydrogenigenes]|uniref:Amino-acid N-acetyltransferase n=1 Tax=Acetobacteroides hydrogenigenes TaxID=979970 RepID=A0A4R2EC43_9BACT|nr:arsenic resistance N-acetyltransferase ArsN2 [Acetobacteroides hydrogenigenes]TCN66408.1 amino-acid N-acetyltransferase [Acetobacteroides hydrogenigenes]
MNISIDPVRPESIEEVKSLLAANNLPTADISDDAVLLFEARQSNEQVGTIGLEKYDGAGLIRSLAVKDGLKGLGIGEKLVNHLLDYCASEQVTELYLLTTTTEKYFEKFGFQQISRDMVSEEIRQTREFKDICPCSAVVMHKPL